MMGRLRYYFDKATAQARREGLGPMFVRVWRFLVARRFFFQFLFEGWEYYVVSPRRELSKTVLRVLKLEPVTGPKVMVYATFDADSRVLPHVVEQVRFFHGAGYQVVWVSNSPQVLAEEFRKIEPFVNVAVHRRNEGYDFAAYAAGYVFAREAKLNSLVIMNDSCYGPAFDFGPILSRFEAATHSVSGFSKIYEITEHIQSYVMHFGSAVTASGVTDAYFRRIRILNSKWAIVRFFEIGGSRFLGKRGIPLAVVIDPKDPVISEVMGKYQLTDPLRDPAATEFIRMGLTPFYKRSNRSS